MLPNASETKAEDAKDILSFVAAGSAAHEITSNEEQPISTGNFSSWLSLIHEENTGSFSISGCTFLMRLSLSRMAALRTFSFSKALANSTEYGMYSPSLLPSIRDRFLPTNVHRRVPTTACFFTIPSSFKNVFGSTSAERMLPKTAARLGVSGRRAHHT